MKEIAVTEYETPSGHLGYRACAPRIPGCVVIHFDPAKAAYLVHAAVMAMNDEPAETDVSDEIAMLSHRSV